MARYCCHFGLIWLRNTEAHGLQDPLSTNEVDKGTKAPTVADMVKHIQCEIAKAVYQTATSEVLGEYFKTQGYVGQVSLTLDVLDTQTVNPGLNFINPIASATNFTMSFAGQYSQSRHRSFNYYFPISLKPTIKASVVVAPDNELCPPDEIGKDNKSRFQGVLGLDTAFYSGLLANLATSKAENPKPATLADQHNLSFTTQVDFQVVWSGGLGPNWTLTTFKGPTGGNGGGVSSQLFNTSNTGKDTVIIAFAPVGVGKASAARANLQAKVKLAESDVVAKSALEVAHGKQAVATLSSVEPALRLNPGQSPAAIAQRSDSAVLNDLHTLRPTLNAELDFVDKGNANASSASKLATQAYINSLRQQKSIDEQMVDDAKARLEDLKAKENELQPGPSAEDIGDAQNAASAALSRYLLEGLQPRLR